MVKRDIPDSWIGDKPEIPPPRVEDKFDRWREMYSIDQLTELTVSDIESTELEFHNKVEALKTEYQPGRLINPAMAQLDGKKPFTQEEFREVRRHISDEAEQIQMNFKQAKRRLEQEREQRRADLLNDIIGQVADSLTNINISIELPKIR